MLFNETIYRNLRALDHFRNDPAWSDFFKKVNRLEKLAIDINNEMHNDPCDTSLLEKKIQKITNELEIKKTDIANRTKNQPDYDAVHKLIGDLKNHFNYTE